MVTDTERAMLQAYELLNANPATRAAAIALLNTVAPALDNYLLRVAGHVDQRS